MIKKLSALLLATLLALGGTTVFAQQQTINIGSAPNDGTGDTLRTAGGKMNSNFTELYGKFPVSIANGGTGVATATDDNALIGNGTTFQLKAFPSCTDTAGNHLNYNTGTNTFSCGTTKSTTVLTTDVSGVLPLANGGGLTTATDDSVAVGNGTILESKAITSCSSASSAMTYNTSTNAFGCNTIASGLNRLSTYYFFDEFTVFTTISAGTISAGTPYMGEFVSLGNGAGSGNGYITGVAGHPAVNSLATGSTTTGWTGGYHCASSSCTNLLLDASNALTIDCEIRVPTLMDGTQTFSFSCGATDSNDGSGYFNGILGQMIWNGSAVRWNLQTKDQSGSTSNSASSGAPSANTWYHMQIVATTGTVTMNIDGAQVAQVTTAANIPNGHGMAEYFEIRKSAGSTTRTAQIDFIQSQQTIATR